MLRIAPIVAGLLLVSCLGSSGPRSIPGYEFRSRLRNVSIGQSIAEVHEIVGDDTVRRPDSDVSIPSPIRTIEFNSHAGQVRVEVYVVGVLPAEGCTGFEYKDIPISYLDGKVVSKDWNFLEWNWQRWGGSLASLRSAQDRFACPKH